MINHRGRHATLLPTLIRTHYVEPTNRQIDFHYSQFMKQFDANVERSSFGLKQ